jgi:flavin reductase (DIM6/NTAB) family NADH-FMN oxidoreductase RutF
MMASGPRLARAIRRRLRRETTVQIDPETTDPAALYKLLIGCVVPRPIAWVSTVDTAGVHNLAPFSFFMGITGAPPTIAFSSGPRAGASKDTVRNIRATGGFVVNVVDDDRAEQMNATSAELPPEVDEFAVARLTPAPCVKVGAPRVLEAPVSMECRPVHTLQIGRGPHDLVIGEIVYFHLRDDVYDAATGRVDMHRLKPVGRLAGHLYAHVHDIFEMKRPNADYRG